MATATTRRSTAASAAKPDTLLADCVANIARAVARWEAANGELGRAMGASANATLSRCSISESVLADASSLEVARAHADATEDILVAYAALQLARSNLAAALCDVRAACATLCAIMDRRASVAVGRFNCGGVTAAPASPAGPQRTNSVAATASPGGPPHTRGANDTAAAAVASLYCRVSDRVDELGAELCGALESHTAMAHVACLRMLPLSCVTAWEEGRGRSGDDDETAECSVNAANASEPDVARSATGGGRVIVEGGAGSNIISSPVSNESPNSQTPSAANSHVDTIGRAAVFRAAALLLRTSDSASLAAVTPWQLLHRLPPGQEDDREHLTLLTAAVLTCPMVEGGRVAALLEGLRGTVGALVSLPAV